MLGVMPQAPAEPVRGFEHGDPVSFSGQIIRSGKSAQSCADDRDALPLFRDGGRPNLFGNGVRKRGPFKRTDCYGFPDFSPPANGFTGMLANTAYDPWEDNGSTECLSSRLEIPFGDRSGHGAHVDVNRTGGRTPRSPFLNAEILKSSEFLLIHRRV
jgi:hypothetical protein